MKSALSYLVLAFMGVAILFSSVVLADQPFPMDPQTGQVFRKRPLLPSVSRGLPSGSRNSSGQIAKCIPPMAPVQPPIPVPFYPPFQSPCVTESAEPSVYMGYLYKDRGAGFKIQFNNGGTPAIGVSSTRNDFDLQGIWLEFAFPVAISKDITGTLTGAHLFSLQPKSTQSYIIPASSSAARWWNPDVFWWEVDVSGAYRLNQYVSAVAGFRWTSLGADFGTPYDERGFVLQNANSETLRTNTYIPYSGIMLENRTDCKGGLKIAGYGSPIVPADFVYRETLSLSNGSSPIIDPQVNIGVGYFLEGFTEYSMRRESVTFGGFVRFTAVHCERTVGWNTGNANIPIDVTLDRKNWIFGGKIGYVF